MDETDNEIATHIHTNTPPNGRKSDSFMAEHFVEV